MPSETFFVRLSILLTCISIPLLLFGTLESKLAIDLGIIYSFTILYFVSLSLLFLASSLLWFSRSNQTPLLFIQIIIFIIALWLSPLIIGASEPVAWHGFTFYGFIDYILRQAHLAPQLLWYHQWPGNWIWYSAGIQVMAFNNTDFLIIIMPFIWQILYLFPVYSFLRNAVGEDRSNYCWAGILIFYLGNWLGQSYIGPQSLAYLLFLVSLALFTKKVESHSQKIILTIIMGALIVIHPLTSVIVFSVTVTLYLTKRIRSIFLVFVNAIFIACWSLYETAMHLQANLFVYIDGIFRIDNFFNVGLANRIVGSSMHITVVYIRIVTTGIFFLIALLGLLAGRGKTSYTDKTVYIIGFGVLALTISLGAVLHENTERTVLFALPLIAYFGVKALKTKLKPVIIIVIILIIAAFPLHFISQYGNQPVDYTSVGDRQSLYFFYDFSYPGYVAGVIPPEPGAPGTGQPFGYFKDVELYTGLTLKQLESNSMPRRDLPVYIPIGRHDEATYTFIHNDTNAFNEILHWLQNNSTYNLVYSNPDKDIFFKTPK